MMSVCINRNFKGTPGSSRESYDKTKLRKVRIEYYDSGDPVVPVGAGMLLVPINTDLAAMEHMLELWSLGSNREEEGCTDGIIN